MAESNTPLLHSQDDAELCVAAQHAGVGFGSFFEGKFFNHRAHAGKRGKAQGGFGIAGGAGGLAPPSFCNSWAGLEALLSM